MNAPWLSVLMFAVAAVLGAVGQLLYKTGAQRIAGAGSSINLWMIGGVLCYAAVMVLFVGAFKRGGALTVLYPIYASTFIWAAVLGLIVYGTPFKASNVAGMALLVLGMYLMGK